MVLCIQLVEEKEPDDMKEKAEKKKLPPLMVFADVECLVEPIENDKKHAAKVIYKRSVVFVNDEDKEDYFVGLEAKRTCVKLDKPIYTGLLDYCKSNVQLLREGCLTFA